MALQRSSDGTGYRNWLARVMDAPPALAGVSDRRARAGRGLRLYARGPSVSRLRQSIKAGLGLCLTASFHQKPTRLSP